MGLVLFLVVFSAIFVAFTDEITALIKRILSVTWVRVLLPMLLVSFLWVWFDEEILWVLAYVKASLAFFTAKFSGVLPHKITLFTGRVLSLYLPASIPACLFYWKLKRDGSVDKQASRLTKLYVFSWLFFLMLVLA
ncbi:MAG: hypothetical protein P1U36_05450 [Legionellaceae bacterium]|nr:hypothetical protein [Legionellaceae bacterium]